jgi:hypothetical protein
MKMEQTQCSETLAFKLQTPGNNPEENIRHSEHGESLKSRIISVAMTYNVIYVNDKAQKHELHTPLQCGVFFFSIS